MTDKIYTINELIEQPSSKLESIETGNEILQIVITTDDKEYIVLHNYYNNFLDVETNMKIDNIKIFRDTFIKNNLSNSQLEFKIFPYLYGEDSSKIIERIESCLTNNQNNNASKDNNIHLFYIPVNGKTIIDPPVESYEKTETGEIVVKVTLLCPGYVFIGKIDEYK